MEIAKALTTGFDFRKSRTLVHCTNTAQACYTPAAPANRLFQAAAGRYFSSLALTINQQFQVPDKCPPCFFFVGPILNSQQRRRMDGHQNLRAKWRIKKFAAFLVDFDRALQN